MHFFSRHLSQALQTLFRMPSSDESSEIVRCGFDALHLGIVVGCGDIVGDWEDCECDALGRKVSGEIIEFVRRAQTRGSGEACDSNERERVSSNGLTVAR